MRGDRSIGISAERESAAPAIEIDRTGGEPAGATIEQASRSVAGVNDTIRR
jgi:hypothetical protein